MHRNLLLTEQDLFIAKQQLALHAAQKIFLTAPELLHYNSRKF